MVWLAGSGRIENSLRLHGHLQIVGDDPGFDDRQPVLRVDLQDSVHLGHGHDDPAALGHAHAAQPRSRAPGGYGDLLPAGQLQDPGNLLRVAGSTTTSGFFSAKTSWE